MIAYPVMNPIAFSLGPMQVHWYGVMYLCGFALASLLATWRNRRFHAGYSAVQLNDLLFYSALGVIIGGRVGYMLFYQTDVLMHEPLALFKIWQGGMSFHGGLVGVMVALQWFAYQQHQSFWVVADFVVPMVPLGLAAGRLGNFINGELWGRVSSLPWAMVFPLADANSRHPSQLYELVLEGLVLWALLWWYARRPRPVGRVSGFFLLGYALARLLAECFREPDGHIGFIAGGWFTEGQLLSLPMLVAGCWLLWRKSE